VTVVRTVRMRDWHEIQVGPDAQNAWLQYRDGHLVVLRWSEEAPSQVWVEVGQEELLAAVRALVSVGGVLDEG
jgi:hypothetical protein